MMWWWFYSSLLLGAILGLAKPANDWSKPCFHGECAYDVPESTGHSGVLQLSGSAITDITPAAGWVILDCDAHALEQEIRLVCSSGDHESAGCNHVFDHGGPLNKVVRLPESCSAAPFLRIANTRVAEDQSIPKHSVGKVSKRDGVTPTVHILQVDANWAAADVSQSGTVNFVFTGTNAPDVDVVSSEGNLATRNVDWDPFGWAKKAWNTVKNAVVNAGKAIVKKLKEVTSFKINPELRKDAHYKTNGDVTIYKLEKEYMPKCDGNGVTANLHVVAGGEITASVKIGLTANGSVIPPSLGSFAVYAILNANVDAHLRVDASVLGHLGTGRKRIAHVDISPLAIPGVISLGPAVELHAQAELDLLLEVIIDAHLKYKIDQLEFWYPRKLTQSVRQAQDRTKAVESKPAPLSISARANVAAEANITGHLIPSLHLGLSVAGGHAASLSAFVEADIWAKAHLRGEVSAQASINPKGGSDANDAGDAAPSDGPTSSNDPEPSNDPAAGNDADSSNDSNADNSTVSDGDAGPNNDTDSSNSRRGLDRAKVRGAAGYTPPYLNTRGINVHDDASVSFKGCIGFYAGVALRAGAQGTVGKYKAETKPWVIYESRPLTIYHNCWGGAIGKRSQTSVKGTSLERRKQPSLKCGKGAPQTVGSGKTEGKKLH